MLKVKGMTFGISWSRARGSDRVRDRGICRYLTQYCVGQEKWTSQIWYYVMDLT